MKFKILKKSSSQNLYHIQRTCTCSTGTGKGIESNTTLRSKALTASCWLVRSDSQGFWFVARNAKDTTTRKLACVSWKSPENFFSHPKSLPKISRKHFYVFLLNAPIFRARKWARDFNSDNSWVLSEDPENFSGDFSAGKISAFEHCLTKCRILAEVWPASLFKKHTIQKILKQTDSEIHFDKWFITKKEKAW